MNSQPPVIAFSKRTAFYLAGRNSANVCLPAFGTSASPKIGIQFHQSEQWIEDKGLY